jgi:hypothetical protein
MVNRREGRETALDTGESAHVSIPYWCFRQQRKSKVMNHSIVHDRNFRKYEKGKPEVPVMKLSWDQFFHGFSGLREAHSRRKLTD